MLWRSRLKKSSLLPGMLVGNLRGKTLPMPLFLVVPLCVWVLNRRGVACCASARWKACAKRRKMVSLNVTSSGRTDLVTPTFLSSLAFVHEWYYSFSREFAIRWNSPLPLKSSRQCDKRHLRLRLYSAESWYVTRLKESKTQQAGADLTGLTT